MKPFGFPKQEKLCSNIGIEATFSAGKNLFCYPYKVFYLESPITADEPFARAMFVVPKKKFKHAVHRNSIRRRMREAYRLNKHTLAEWCSQNGLHVKLIIMYVATNQEPFAIHQKAAQCLFSSLIQKLSHEVRP